MKVSDKRLLRVAHRTGWVFLNQIIFFFAQIMYDPSDGVDFNEDDFPDALCHIHTNPANVNPLGSDWTKECDPSWSEEMKEEMCSLFQETSWDKGSQVSRRSSAFIASNWGSVGYSKNGDNEGNVDCGEVGERGTDGSSNTFD